MTPAVILLAFLAGQPLFPDHPGDFAFSTRHDCQLAGYMLSRAIQTNGAHFTAKCVDAATHETLVDWSKP